MFLAISGNLFRYSLVKDRTWSAQLLFGSKPAYFTGIHSNITSHTLSFKQLTSTMISSFIWLQYGNDTWPFKCDFGYVSCRRRTAQAIFWYFFHREFHQNPEHSLAWCLSRLASPLFLRTIARMVLFSAIDFSYWYATLLCLGTRAFLLPPSSRSSGHICLLDYVKSSSTTVFIHLFLLTTSRLCSRTARCRRSIQAHIPFQNLKGYCPWLCW